MFIVGIYDVSYPVILNSLKCWVHKLEFLGWITGEKSQFNALSEVIGYPIIPAIWSLRSASRNIINSTWQSNLSCLFASVQKYSINPGLINPKKSDKLLLKRRLQAHQTCFCQENPSKPRSKVASYQHTVYVNIQYREMCMYICVYIYIYICLSIYDMAIQYVLQYLYIICVHIWYTELNWNKMRI